MWITQVLEVTNKIIEGLQAKLIHFYIVNILLQIINQLNEQRTNVCLLIHIGYNELQITLKGDLKHLFVFWLIETKSDVVLKEICLGFMTKVITHAGQHLCHIMKTDLQKLILNIRGLS